MELGFPNVAEMLDSMPAGMLDYWQVVDEQIGLSDRRHHKEHASMMAATFGAAGVSVDPRELEYDLEARQQRRERAKRESEMTEAEQLAAIRGAFGGVPMSPNRDIPKDQRVKLA